MSKKIEDYLHLYIGCQVMELYNNKVGRLVGVSDKEVLVLHKTQWCLYFDEVKPILRRLSSMTKEEYVEMYNALYPGVDTTDERKYHIIMAQCTHPGMYWEGSVSIQDYVNWFPYLLSKGFDLFGLIDEGLAIDAATLEPKTKQ